MKRIYFTQLTFLLILSFTFAQENSDPIGLDEGGLIDNQIEEQFTDEELAAEQTISISTKQYPDWLIGEWNAIQVDTRLNLNLEESGKGQLKNTEGNNTESTEIDWSVDNDIFIITIQEETSRLIMNRVSDVGFGLFEQLPKSESTTFFYRAGVKVRPSFLVGTWQAQDNSGRELVMEAGGNFTLTSQDSLLTGKWAQQDYELVLESIGESPVIRYELFSLAEGLFVIKEQPSNIKLVFLKK